MTEFKFNLSISVTAEDIDDIMQTALDGGIVYWCRKVEVVEDKYFGEWASDQISRGGSLRLYEREGGDRWLLTRNYLIEGIRKAIIDGYGNDWLDGNKLDTMNIGSVDADIIIQYAIFDEIVFGKGGE